MMTRTVSLGIACTIWLMALVTPLSAGNTNNAVKVVQIQVFPDGLQVEFSGDICDLDGVARNVVIFSPESPPQGPDYRIQSIMLS